MVLALPKCLGLDLMLAECKINFPGGGGGGGGWVAGLTKNKANSAQLGLAGAWAELGNIWRSTMSRLKYISTKRYEAFDCMLVPI